MTTLSVTTKFDSVYTATVTLNSLRWSNFDPRKGFVKPRQIVIFQKKERFESTQEYPTADRRWHS